MSGLSIHAKRQLAEQLARELLNKSGQYRFGIPQSVLNAKANEFMRLSDKELQQKFNEYFQSTGLNAKPKDLWDSMGLNLEQKKKAQANMESLQTQVNKKYMRPTSSKTKKVGANQTTKPLPKDVKKEIRQFMATLLQQTYSQKVEEFRNYLLNNKTSFAELGMELHDLGAKVADGLTSVGVVVDRSDTRAEIREKLIDKQAKAGVLADCVDDEEKFNELFKEYFNEDFDYQTAFDYICATNDFSTSESSDKIEKFNKKLNNITKYTIKSADDYMKNASGAGGLLDLAFNVALMYGSGGTSAIAKYAQMTAKGGTELAGKVITNVAGKKVAQSTAGQAISQGVGIVAAQTTSAGLNAVAFQGTKVADLAGETLATGEFNTDKAENIVASAEGLFKFGYVGGAISGPLGMQVKNMTTKLLNSKPIINQILTKGITNKPTPLTSVLKDISEHSEAVGEVLKFGTEFGINAGYMAYDEGISYTDAMANLAQMDGVSKMVLAMLGAKNMSFLTPEKVQQIKTDLAGYKVNIAVKGSQKVYSVKDAQGKETVLSSPEELFMFILDKEAKAVGVRAETKAETASSKVTKNDAKEIDVAQTKDVAPTETTGKKPYDKPEIKVDLTLEAKAQVKDVVQNIRNDYGTSFDQIKADLKAMGLDKIGNMSIRLKGEQSLYDKIANYMLEHKDATLEEAIKDVRDAIGARTVVESGKFANHPEVKALLDAGKEREAMLRAAELQSEPAVESLKAEILKQEQSKNNFAIARISNYVSPDGIPYLSENQLADLKQFAANHGVKLKINLRIDTSDPNFSKVDENYKPTTKSQPSGYTALQANFTTKDGKIVEWQFRGDKVNEFAEGEHIPYDLRTGKNIIGEHKELEELYNPFIEMLSEKNMKKETYKEYNRYLGDYYTHLRKLELGFDSVEPKLEDYGNGFKFDERLSAKNLIALHKKANKIITSEKLQNSQNATIEDVKNLFETGKLEKNFIFQFMEKQIAKIPPEKKDNKHIIDLSLELTESDYRNIMELLNIHNGKYIRNFISKENEVENIQKLALFSRMLDFTHQKNDFLEFNEEQWDVVVEGIIKKPKELIAAVMIYKYSSTDINNYLSLMASDKVTEKNASLEKNISDIDTFLKLFTTKKEFVVYRGDLSFNILNSLTATNGNKLGEELSSYIQILNQKFEALKQIDNPTLRKSIEDDTSAFIVRELQGITIEQPRYLSTAMSESATKKYAKAIKWKITVPKGINGASIESYNVEREPEAEFLMERNLKLRIANAKFEDGILVVDAVISKPSLTK